MLFALMRSLFDNQQGCDLYCIIYYTFLLFTAAKHKLSEKVPSHFMIWTLEEKSLRIFLDRSLKR